MDAGGRASECGVVDVRGDEATMTRVGEVRDDDTE